MSHLVLIFLGISHLELMYWLVVQEGYKECNLYIARCKDVLMTDLK